VLLALVAAGSCRRKHFPPRGDAAAVVVVVPHKDAAGPPQVAEREPNDDPQQAQVLDIGADRPVSSIEGSLSAPGKGKGKDVDVFKILVPGVRQDPTKVVPALDAGAQPYDPRALARRMTLEIASLAGDGLSVQLIDEALKSVETISIQSGGVGGMPNMAVSPGYAYYIRIKPAGRGGKKPAAEQADSPYKLTVRLGDFEVADEREPDDTKETAIPVALVGTTELAGYHGWWHDDDFYRVPLPELVSALDVDLDAVDGVAASLQVFDASGRLALARGRRAERLALRNVILHPAPATADPVSRVFYVVVRSESGHNIDRRYVLRLALGAPKTNGEIEPNDTLETATPVRDGTFTGYLPIGDVDYFRYEGEGQRDVTFEVSFPSRVRGRLTALRPGNLPAGSAGSRKARQTIVLPGIATQGQPLCLCVSQGSRDGNSNDAYSLTITSVPSPNGKGGTENPASPPVPR